MLMPNLGPGQTPQREPIILPDDQQPPEGQPIIIPDDQAPFSIDLDRYRRAKQAIQQAIRVIRYGAFYYLVVGVLLEAVAFMPSIAASLGVSQYALTLQICGATLIAVAFIWLGLGHLIGRGSRVAAAICVCLILLPMAVGLTMLALSAPLRAQFQPSSFSHLNAVLGNPYLVAIILLVTLCGLPSVAWRWSDWAVVRTFSAIGVIERYEAEHADAAQQLARIPKEAPLPPLIRS